MKDDNQTSDLPIARPVLDAPVQISSEAGASESVPDARELLPNTIEVLFNANPTGLLLVNGDGQILMANWRVTEITGYSVDELRGRPIELLVPESVRAAHVVERDRYIQSPHHRQMGVGRELWGLKKDGTQFPVEVGLNPVETAEGVRFLASVVDITERRHSEQRQQQLSAIVESANDAIISQDLDGTILSWNRGAELLYGYSAEEAIGRNVSMLEVRDEDDESIFDAPTGDSFIHRGAKTSITCEISRVRKDGSVVPVSVTASPIRDKENRLLGVSSIARDITEQRLARERLTQHEYELQTITDNIPALISYVGADMRYRFVNRRYCDVWGLEQHEFLDKTVEDIIGSEAFETAAPLIQKAMAGEQVKFEFLVRVPTRPPFWASVTYTPDQFDGEVRGIFATVVETTELKQAENRFERALNGANDGLYDWPIDRQSFFCGRRFNELLKRPDHDQRWKHDEYYALVHPDDLGHVKNEVAKHIDGASESYECEYRVRMPNGDYEWILSRGRITADAVGQKKHFAGSIQSIHKQKLLEIQLREEVEQRDRFLAMLSHELRNPLGAISNSIEVAKQSNGEMSQVEAQTQFAAGRTDDRAYLGVISRQCQQMQHLLDDLLDVSRIQHNKMTLRRSVFDLRTVVDAVRPVVQPQSDAKYQRLQIDVPQSPLMVNADQDRILQCLVNLVNNAIRYTPPGGSIELGLSESEPSDTSPASALCRITDSGIGMTNELANRVFELFSQADESIARSDSGMGVGLALVEGIINLHQGLVSAESAGPGQGSTFTFSIPLASHAQEVLSAPAPAIVEVVKSVAQQIVLIDDLPEGREMLGLWLQLKGFEVHEAADGASGLSLIEKHKPDTVLIDIGLPDMNGHDVAVAIRDSTESQVPLLIAVTGYGLPADIAAARSAGFDHHLTKPLDLRILAGLLGIEHS